MRKRRNFTGFVKTGYMANFLDNFIPNLYVYDLSEVRTRNKVIFTLRDLERVVSHKIDFQLLSDGDLSVNLDVDSLNFTFSFYPEETPDLKSGSLTELFSLFSPYLGNLIEIRRKDFLRNFICFWNNNTCTNRDIYIGNNIKKGDGYIISLNVSDNEKLSFFVNPKEVSLIEYVKDTMKILYTDMEHKEWIRRLYQACLNNNFEGCLLMLEKFIKVWDLTPSHLVIESEDEESEEEKEEVIISKEKQDDCQEKKRDWFTWW